MTLQLKLKQLDPEILKIRAPYRVKDFLVKRYHRKRLSELSIESLGQIPRLEEPTYDQKVWVVRRLRGPVKSWKVWDQ
jgi:hypothetical protein